MQHSCLLDCSRTVRKLAPLTRYSLFLMAMLISAAAAFGTKTAPRLARNMLRATSTDAVVSPPPIVPVKYFALRYTYGELAACGAHSNARARGPPRRSASLHYCEFTVLTASTILLDSFVLRSRGHPREAHALPARPYRGAPGRRSVGQDRSRRRVQRARRRRDLLFIVHAHFNARRRLHPHSRDRDESLT